MNYGTTVSVVAKGVRLSAVSMLLTLMMGLLAVSQPARASTYMVTNTNNSGPGSLRQAIHEANSHPGPDIITFDGATNGVAIVLSGAANENANAGGDLDILDGGDLTIQGNGAANTIIDGGGNDRVFHICPGGGCTNTITIDGVAIRSGRALVAPTVQGGGIHNQGATLNLVNCRVGENLAAVGGGIYNTGGSVTLDDTHVTGNIATMGGGIHNQGTLTIQNGSVIGDTGSGTGNRADDGGGISNVNGTSTVHNSAVISNTAANDGGGIWNNGTLDILNSSNIGEVAAGNHADNGGGIYNAPGGVVTVDSSDVISNTATENGGGIWNNATLDVQNGSAIGATGAGNRADQAGGGIYNLGGATVDASTINANHAPSGGGIHNSGTATVDGTTVGANTADYGGGIRNFGTLDVENGSLIGGAGMGNEAILGGGIYNTGGGHVATVDASTISANIAQLGGGIYNFEYSRVNVQNGSAIGVSGAGNQASEDGGGIMNYDGVVMVDSSSVSANVAGDNGGGIANRLDLSVGNGSTINANRADHAGGGIYSSYIATITDTRILNNTAGTNGGGVFSDVSWSNQTSVTGSCIVGNSAMSFLNNKPEQQIATGNWWGAASGPNTPGADTYGGNVDVSGHLSAPILGCAPELEVGKVNDTGGSGVVGTPFHWTLTISNTGMISATFAPLQTILVDDLPGIGPTYGTPTVGHFVDVEGGANIQCSITGGILTCTAASGAVTLAPRSSHFDVTFAVTPSVPMTLVNPAGDCRVDPDGHVAENDETNNGCPANVVDVEASANIVCLPLVLR